MAKKILIGKDARDEILKGVQTLTDAVASTMGPKGRNVIIEKGSRPPIVTKDGVTVAKEIELEDPVENMGAQLVKQAATKTNTDAGDGTTTATILANAIMTEGLKHMKSGSNAISIKRGIDKAVGVVVGYLDTIKKDISSRDEYKAVATISAQNDEIGEKVADAMDKVGKGGVVTVEPGKTFGIEMEFVEGMKFNNGYIAPVMITDVKKFESNFENPLILITDKKITSFDEILPIFEKVSETGKKEIVIICEDFTGEALQTLAVNRLRGAFAGLAIKAPSFGDRRKDILEDIAILTGARVITEDLGLKLENVELEDLGTCDRIVSTKSDTTIICGSGENKELVKRIEHIKNEIDHEKSDFEKDKLTARLAKLSGGVAVIKVGAATEIEQKERQDRTEDALAATKAAAEEGIIAGGGTALLRCIPILKEMKLDNKDELAGVGIVIGALSSPLRIIADNAGKKGEDIVAKVMDLKDNFGYNALTNEYEDLVKAMVIDPKKVTRCALENAASVASMFLTLEAAITEIPKPPAPMMGPTVDLTGM